MNPDSLLARAFVRKHPRRAAERLQLAGSRQVAQLLEDCDRDVAAEVLQHLDPLHGGKVVGAMPAGRRRGLLGAIPPRRVALLLQEVEENLREAWLGDLSPELARALRTALVHPPESTARVMDPAVLAAPVEMTAGRARRLVSRHPQRALYYLYVTDDQRRPVGVVNLRELMGAAAGTPLSALMTAPVTTVAARASTAVAAAHPGWKTLHALPVVDEAGVLVGVLRYETGERIRGRTEEGTAAGGVGVALTEALWTVGAHVVDEVAEAIRSRESSDG